MSVKIHVLLFLPALLLNLNYHFGLIKTLLSVAFIGVAQLLIGLKWIMVFPQSYFAKVFEFNRGIGKSPGQFAYSESVNWQFVSEAVMTSKVFGNFLLASHLLLLLVFLFGKWSHPARGLGAWLTELRLNELGNTRAKPLNPRFVALSMFACNMIGILCLRSMHSQFYTWYQQTMPLLLLFAENYPAKYRQRIYIFVEISANLGVHFIVSSMLFVGHASILVLNFFKTVYPSPYLALKKE